ncbi:cell division protein ZapE [Maritimibacter sp. 55A14]|uniref:cell division protein ZapE n=1 Tax=Maritimibacter sp. 55A14 TaxID=2174844 RepID=UPI000D611EEE|nr:cell division protein ZapE [Maritimibacter sp. 55A14]PWE29317.1 cell division protein ZapE [Maritimibacter sp. 55A14]
MAGRLTEIYEARVAAEDIRYDPEQVEVLHRLEATRTALEAAPAKPGGLLKGLFRGRPAAPDVGGMYIWGGVGRGKSMLMDMFHDAVEIEAKRRVHFHAFMQEVHSRLHEVRKTGVNDAIAPVAAEITDATRLLCFDEMQITDITDAMLVGRLFERLFAGGVVVVTTSNRPPSDLYKDGLNRQLFLPFIELLSTQLEIHHLHSATDYRQDRLAGSEVYFTPADQNARAAIEAIWQEFAGGPGEVLHLPVKGRDVQLPQFRNGVGRAGFWDLCAQPLGAADYLAIANAVRVLILENIPELSRRNFNEARRFVTLIDALYEARVRLVASAASPPEWLYVEGEGSFEFERTASRLREMQSADWWA